MPVKRTAASSRSALLLKFRSGGRGRSKFTIAPGKTRGGGPNRKSAGGTSSNSSGYDSKQTGV